MNTNNADMTLSQILLIGKMQHGKSQFIKKLSKDPVDIEIGDDMQSCTKEIKYYEVQLRGKTSTKVVMVDTVGMDQGEE